MKRMMMLFGMTLASCAAMAYTEYVDGIEWTYTVSDGKASVGGGSSSSTAVPNSTKGAIAIPSTLGGYPVTSIGRYAFDNCSGLTSMTIPSSVTSIGDGAFRECSGLTNVTIPDSVTSIGGYAFSACSELTSMTIPSGVTSIGEGAFANCSEIKSVTVSESVTSIGSSAFIHCSNLKSVTFKGHAPACGDCAFEDTPSELVIHAETGPSGWIRWQGKAVECADAGSASGTVATAQLTVTNVVIHYVVNSVTPEKAYPAVSDTGFVNIITEVKPGGAVSVPTTWMEIYPNYVAKFGSDFTKSLMAETGKKDGANMPMRVWQDYVAGTDPTNPDDVFKASITTDASGKVIISCTPELTAEEKAMRVYTTYGKKSLIGKADWEIVEEGREADYNFFKVTVEMK